MLYQAPNGRGTVVGAIGKAQVTHKVLYIAINDRQIISISTLRNITRKQTYIKTWHHFTIWPAGHELFPWRGYQLT